MTAPSQDAEPLRRIAELESKLQASVAETERLRQALARSRERQAAGTDILATIAATAGDADRALQQIAETTARLFGASAVSILLAENGGWGKAYRYGTSEQRIRAAVPLTDVKIGGGNLPGAVVGRNRQMHIPDLDRLDGELAEFPGLPHARAAGSRTMCGTPLRSKGQAIGALIIHRDRLEPFSEEELALQQSFADQAAIAIENARLFNETREALERQTATADILKVIASSPSDIQPVFEAIAHSAKRLIGGFSTAVFRFVDEVAHLVAFTPTRADADEVLKAGFPTPVDRFEPFRLAQGGRPVEIADIESRPESQIKQIARARGFRAMLFAPLMSNDRPIGLISVTRIEAGAFREQHVELLRTFADQAVIAIENARLFEAVQQRTRELSQSLDDLRTAQDRLVQTEKLAALGQLTAGIAHEIKNPLNFVNNFSSLSVELVDELNETLGTARIPQDLRGEVDELTGLLRDNLQKVVQHGQRADSIVKNMLLHSREGSGDHRPTDVNALVEESLNLAYHGARAEKPQFNVTLVRDLDPAAGTVEAFPQEITRVLLNLIANGFYALVQRKQDEASPSYEPTLSASTRGDGRHVLIRIHDNGTGIPSEVREKMFSPFFTTKPAGEGTGLGLSMSHDIIVKQHGGTIEVESVPGEFTAFTIRLPRQSTFSEKTRGST